MKKNIVIFMILFCFFSCNSFNQLHAMDEECYIREKNLPNALSKQRTSIFPYEDEESWCTKKQKILYSCCAAFCAICGIGGFCVCLTTGASVGFEFLFKNINSPPANQITALLQKHDITWKQFLKMLKTIIAYKT